ncbi:MAG: hypothetical protein AMJ65_15575 [Phycisphaerae bacterium SG8_4]|nr:MAG: hypothetical protein AMJ65_15575 [Phycisphaerae bacterium SG8_4]
MYRKPIFALLLSLICIPRAGVYAESVGIVHYDVEMKVLAERNAVQMRTRCTIRNDGAAELTQLAFDLLAREGRCKARTEVQRIWQQVSGNPVFLKFKHGQNGQESSERKLVDVTLASGLAPGSSTEVAFDYAWQATDPTNTRDNYRPLATLPDGSKEICLLSDIKWLPVVQPVQESGGPNRFALQIKPSWVIKAAVPADWHVVALGGRHVKTVPQTDRAVFVWKSTVPFYPQLMAGRFQKQIVETESTKVVLYLPKGYDPGLVERIGYELARAYDFYTDTFGRLEGDEIHIGVSSAGQGGHGGYLSFTMDTNMLGRQITKETLPMVMEPMRHELAHSWWGWSVTSYGPGTKFLRESMANFASSYFVEKTTGQDRLAADMAKLFWTGLHTDLICGAQGDSERAAYMKGPVVLNVLRQEMGEPQFFKVLKHFASQYRGGHAKMSDFISTCGQITGEDWKEFFDQWCFGTGVPDYRIEKFDSTQRGEKWQTEVVIRNAGGAMITCPLELQMANENYRKSFKIEPGQKKTLTFTTQSRVTQAVVDPEHRTCQGSGAECRLKMLGVGEVEAEWIWYWRGVVLTEEGQYDRAIGDISRAMDRHSHPAFSYSRGIAHLKNGDIEAARSDVVAFLDWVAKSNDPRRSLVYPGLLSQDSSKQWDQLNHMLQTLTGQNLRTHEQWRKWWGRAREDFQPALRAQQLGPGGLTRSG